MLLEHDREINNTFIQFISLFTKFFSNHRSIIDTKRLTPNNLSLYIYILKNPYSTNTRLNRRRNTATPLPISSQTPPPRQDRREQSRQSRLPLLSHNPLSRRTELAHSSYLLSNIIATDLSRGILSRERIFPPLPTLQFRGVREKNGPR